MKKRIIATSILLTLLTAEARISPEEYYQFMTQPQQEVTTTSSSSSSASVQTAPKFSRFMDLIRGTVLKDSGILENYRFYGWGQFAEVSDLQANQNPADSCSYLDFSKDPVMDLIIQLFPSVGTGLNANGTGSFYDMVSRLTPATAPDREDQINTKIANIIADFFKIAQEIRGMPNPMEHGIFAFPPSEENDVALVKEHFSSSSVGSKVFKGENVTKALARAARNIARATLVEKTSREKTRSLRTSRSKKDLETMKTKIEAEISTLNERIKSHEESLSLHKIQLNKLIQESPAEKNKKIQGRIKGLEKRLSLPEVSEGKKQEAKNEIEQLKSQLVSETNSRAEIEKRKKEQAEIEELQQKIKQSGEEELQKLTGEYRKIETELFKISVLQFNSNSLGLQLLFPDFFVNDLISAYAMEALSPDKLPMLSQKVAKYSDLEKRALTFKKQSLDDAFLLLKQQIDEKKAQMYASVGGKEEFEAREKEYIRLEEEKQEFYSKAEELAFKEEKSAEECKEMDAFFAQENEKEKQLESDRFKYREIRNELMLLELKLSQLKAKISKLGAYVEEVDYTSPIAQQFHDKIANSFSPFYPGGGTIKMARSTYTEDGRSFNYADCAETAVRQLLVVLMGTGFGGNFRLAEDRIDQQHPSLTKELFYSEGRPVDLTQFATDCSQAARNRIAQFMCGHKDKGIKYASEWKGPSDTGGWELRAGLDNITKIVCRLLEGYKGVDAVEKRIQEVNERAVARDEAYFQNPANIEAIFKDLAQIRTDTTLELEFVNLRFEGGRILGQIKITFPDDGMPGVKDNTVLILDSVNIHAEFKSEGTDGYRSGDEFKPIIELYEAENEDIYSKDYPLYILKILTKNFRDSTNNADISLVINAVKKGLYGEEIDGIVRLCTRTSRPIKLVMLLEQILGEIKRIPGLPENDCMYKGKEEQCKSEVECLEKLIKILPRKVFDKLNTGIYPTQPKRKENLISSVVFMRIFDKENFEKELPDLRRKFEEKMKAYEAARIWAAEHFLFGESNEELLKDVMVAHPEDLLNIFEDELYNQCLKYRTYHFEKPNFLPMEILIEKLLPYMDQILENPETSSETWIRFMHALSMFDLEQLSPDSEKSVKDLVERGKKRFEELSVPLHRLFWRAIQKNFDILLPVCYLTKKGRYIGDGDPNKITLEEILGADYKAKGVRIPADILPSFLSADKESALWIELLDATNFTTDSLNTMINRLDILIKKEVLSQYGYPWEDLFTRLIKEAKQFAEKGELIEKLKLLNIIGYYDEAKTQPKYLVNTSLFD